MALTVILVLVCAIHTYTWSIPEPFNWLKHPATKHPHGEGSATVIHNAPWAGRKVLRLVNLKQNN